MTHRREAGGQRLFRLGVLLFAAANLTLLLLTYWLAGAPRLGDDSLIYLWKGDAALMGEGSAYPGLRDILAQDRLAAHPAEPGHIKSVVHQVYTGTVRPLGDLYYSAVRAMGLGSHASAFLGELLLLGVMVAAVAALLRTFFPPDAAGVGLLLLSFAVLPRQGLYSLIPSTFALYGGMLLWVWLYRAGLRANPLLAAVAAFLVASLHPIGRLWAALGVPVHALGVGAWRMLFTPRAVLLYGAMGVGALCSFLWPWLHPPFAMPPGVHTGAVSPGNGLLENLLAAGTLLKDPLVRKNGLLMLLAVSGLWLVHARLPVATRRLLAGFAALLLLSLLHHLPGYPAELFSRVLVPATVLLAGVAGGALLAGVRHPRWGRWVLAGALLWYLVTGVLWFRSYLFTRVNDPAPVLEESLFRAQLTRLPQGASILYAEPYYGLMMSLLNGGVHWGAVSWPTLKDDPAALVRVMDDKRPAVALAVAMKGLNTLSDANLKRLEPRRLGFHAGVAAALELRLMDDNTAEMLYVFTASLEQPVTLMVTPGAEPETAVTLAAGPAGWRKVWSGTPAGRLRLTLPEGAGWIEGLRFTPPAEGDEGALRWPWNRGVVITWEQRHPRRERDRMRTVEVSVPALLDYHDAGGLSPWLAPDPAYADAGGVVFLRTRFAGVGRPADVSN